MRHNIRDLAVFEKLATVSRASSTFELLWYLDLELSHAKTVINALFRNVANGDLITDAIAPEYIGYCSVGSFFKNGKKLEVRPGAGVIRDIAVAVPAKALFYKIGDVITDAEYNLNFTLISKHGQSDFAYLCKKQKCMVFLNGADKVIIPCTVIAATYYLTSHSMRIQLFAQNIHGLYEEIHYDPPTETAYIIMHRNGRTEDAKHIARFALSQYSRQCWENVMNSVRESAFRSYSGTEYCRLIAKMPVVQEFLPMKVRCHEFQNQKGGTTILVHEILRELSDLPFRTLCVARRESAPPDSHTNVKTELDAKSDGRQNNKSPSKAYKGHQVQQFNVPDNPIWRDIEFIQVTLPPRSDSAELMTVTEQSDETVELSPQKDKGNDPKNKVAGSSLEQVPPKKDATPRMALSEFRDMASGFETMEGVTKLFISSDLAVPLKNNDSRNRLTVRESYKGTIWYRRHYLYSTFRYGNKWVCLVEIDQTGISTHIGTFVLAAAYLLDETTANRAADDFVNEVRINKMKSEWKLRHVFFDTKSHPPKQALDKSDKETHEKSYKDLRENWRLKVLKMVE